jgi:WD40 repeat protein
VKLWDFDPKEFKKEYGTVALPLMSIDTPDPVSILRASLDGSFLVAACKDKRIRKIRARDGKVIAEFAGHKSIVTAIELSEDSELLVSGANDCVIKVWHTDNAKEMRSLKGHLGAITALVITGDTQEIFSGSMDQSIRVWDVASAEQTHYIPSHQVASLAVSADMKVIVSGGFDGVVRVIKKFEMVWCTMRLLGPRSLTTANAFGVVGLAELKEATKPVKYFLQNAKGGISTPKPPEDGEAEEEG